MSSVSPRLLIKSGTFEGDSTLTTKSFMHVSTGLHRSVDHIFGQDLYEVLPTRGYTMHSNVVTTTTTPPSSLLLRIFPRHNQVRNVSNSATVLGLFEMSSKWPNGYYCYNMLAPNGERIPLQKMSIRDHHRFFTETQSIQFFEGRENQKNLPPLIMRCEEGVNW